jgi:hypothetical protein
MAVQLKDGSAVAGGVRVDSGSNGLRVAIVPTTPSMGSSFGIQSGNVTTLAAGATVWSFRNTANIPIVIRRIGIGFVATTAFTAAQAVNYSLYVARSWTVADSAGTAVTITGNTNKKRTTFNNFTGVEMRVASASAVTAGTRTLDTNPMTILGAWVGAVGGGIAPDINNLFNIQDSGYPIVLAQNEGIVIANVTLMGAGGVGVVTVNASIDEYTTGTY